MHKKPLILTSSSSSLRIVGSSFTPAPGGAKNRTSPAVELGTAKINLLPSTRHGVNKLIFKRFVISYS